MKTIHPTPGPWGANGCIGRSEIGESGGPEWSIGTDRGDIRVYGAGLRAYHGPKETREQWERATVTLIAKAPELLALADRFFSFYELHKSARGGALGREYEELRAKIMGAKREREPEAPCRECGQSGCNGECMETP
jgi:hypothetical protein